MITLRSTVFPQPLSPMIAIVCPRGIESSISRNTGWRAKLKPNSWIPMSAAIRSFDLGVLEAMSVGLRPHHLGPKNTMNSIQSDAKEKIEHQDNHERQHEGGSGGSANSLRAGRTIKTAVATHNGDRRPEEYAFENPVK